jgi:hypothetical protein
MPPFEVSDEEFERVREAGIKTREFVLSVNSSANHWYSDSKYLSNPKVIPVEYQSTWTLLQRGNALIMKLPRCVTMAISGQPGRLTASEVPSSDRALDVYTQATSTINATYDNYGTVPAFAHDTIESLAMEFEEDRLTFHCLPTRDMPYEHTMAIALRVFDALDPEANRDLRADIVAMAEQHTKVKLCRDVERMTLAQLAYYLGFPVLHGCQSYAVINNLINPKNNSVDGTLALIHQMPRVQFPKLFREYVGVKSPTLMKLAGERLMVGHEYCRMRFHGTMPEGGAQQTRERFADVILADEGDHIILVGNRTITPHIVWYVKFLLGYLTIDRVRRIIEKMGGKELGKLKDTYNFVATNYHGEEPRTKALDLFLGRFSDETKEELISTMEFREFVDVERQLTEFRAPESIPESLRASYPEGLKMPRSWKTFKELHDKVSRGYNEIKAEANNKKIEYPADLPHLALDGVVLGRPEGLPENQPYEPVTARLPRETKELVEWGRKLNICIASYADRAQSGHLVLVGFFKGDEVVYAMEMPPKLEPVGAVESTDNTFGVRFKSGIRQLVQHGNKPVEEPHRGAIVRAVNSLLKEDAGNRGL